MKDTDILLSRAEKLRRDARSVRRDATRLSDASDRDRMLHIANTLEAAARDLECRAWRRVRQVQAAASPQAAVRVTSDVSRAASAS